jgi:hypothetical protein
VISLSFNAIYIPLFLTGIGALWAAWFTFSPSSYSWGWVGLTFLILFGWCLPGVPVLIAWLVWALLR